MNENTKNKEKKNMEEFKKKHGRSTEPEVSISSNNITFNYVLASLAGLRNVKSVGYFIDTANRKLGFQFNSKAAAENTYSVFPVKNSSTFKSSCGALVKNLPWLTAIVSNNDSKKRRLKVKQEGKLWIAYCIPSFENKVNVSEIYSVVPSEASGIYRYKDKTGQIIYIGRGNIKNRLAEPERKEWNIETVEYSEIADQKDQITWEKYWLDDFKNNNNGKLPYYNKTP